MDCKEFERRIPDFINNKMDFMTLNQFEEHMQHCDNCKEELVIQFLVTEGMQRLEEGDSFDLQNELDQRLEEAQRKVRFHNGFLYAGAVLEILTMMIIAFIILWMVQ